MNVLPNYNIIKSFPDKEQAIIELCASDPITNELCEDYEVVLDAIIKAVSEMNSNESKISSSLIELKKLKRVLEQELLERLEAPNFKG